MPGKAIRARGVVQGVGFRPAIWHLARRHGLTGEVWNDGEGVMIHAFGNETQLTAFIAQIPGGLPPLARLDALECTDIAEACHAEFRIVASRQDGINTPIAADAATCPACLADIADANNRRYRYPFTNCTHCGPRLSIVRQVPYDRCHTSMAEFDMCPDCQREYADPADRRFHAQANCCPACGPMLRLTDNEGQIVPTLRVGTQPEPLCGSRRWSIPDQAPTQSMGAIAPADVIQQTADLIRQGHIVAIKGLGGFHLACDAGSASAVAKLRQRKRRYAKPFALMARNMEMLRRYAQANEAETQALQDKAAPIVLLPVGSGRLAEDVAPGENKLGFMLPYTPLHTLLMQALDAPIVLTSGNLSDEPQCTDNAEALQRLAGIADYWLLHDRGIVNRLDDSVARSMAGEVRLLRRGRGYSPEALPLPAGFEAADGILAMGAELKNSFCLLKQGQAIVSQHIGDLENAAVQQDYRAAIALYRQLFAFEPKRYAVDLHPGYLSSQYGRNLAATDEQIVPVQHHYAHLAACLVEHGVPLQAPPVLAAVFDGLGMGEHGELWGGEFLLGDYRSFRRLGRFQPIALPGASQAMRQPWRNVYAQLRHYFAWPELQATFGQLDIMRFLATQPLPTLDAMLDKGLNSPLCSSSGRWFDAFAAALSLHAEQVAYEGQAAIGLETLAEPAFANQTPYPGSWCATLENGLEVLSWRGLWLAVLADLQNGVGKADIAARIHHSLIDATLTLLLRFSDRTGADNIVLSGGVFQNRLLLEGVSQGLRQQGKTVLIPQRYPPNDGGLALGQAAVAAARMLESDTPTD